MTSDLASQIPAELESMLQLKALRYLGPQRPWLDLYGVNVRPVAPFGSVSRRPNPDPALIHRVLPDELLFEVFIRMNPYDMGRAARVCRKWKYTLRNPVFWRNACLRAWQLSGIVENYKVLQSKYDSSWRKMWLLRPRIRTDGLECAFVVEPYYIRSDFFKEALRSLYVSRNTYIRTGVREWEVTNPVHLVCYYRYMRFYPSGRFLYKNSYQVVKEVVKCMNLRASKADSVFDGHYTLKEDRVEAAFVYPGLRPTLWRVCLRLRGTVVGANNRMDLLSLTTSGLNGDFNGAFEDNIFENNERREDEEFDRCSHKRGLAPFTFVPFEEAEKSVLNLPVDKMDYYVPG